MNTPFITNLENRGICIKLLDEELILGPKERVTKHILNVAKQHKEEIIKKHHYRNAQIELMEHLLSSRGWLLMSSSVLGECILIVRDNTINIPENLYCYVDYTLEEMRLLIRANQDQLKMVHMLKHKFDGIVEIPYDDPFIDPRADLVEDSLIWSELLNRTQFSSFYGVLHGFRCYGAKLRLSGLYYDPNCEGFHDQADYDKSYSEWILPILPELNKVLGELSSGELSQMNLFDM